MRKLSEGLLKEANRLCGGPFHEGLLLMRKEYLVNLLNADKEQDFRHLQGVIKSLDEVIGIIETARETIENGMKHKPDMNKSF